MAFLDALRKADGVEDDFLREGVKHLVREVMAEEVTALVGAEPYERKETRENHRNGYRHREWDTRVMSAPIGDDRAGDPEATDGELLPELSRAEEAFGAGAGERGCGGLSPRGEHSKSRIAGPVAGDRESVEEPGEPPRLIARRAGEGVSDEKSGC